MPIKPFNDLTGQVFSRLTAIRYAGRSKYGNHQWFCACECGAECHIEGYHLLAGRTKSCGCYRRDRGMQIAKDGSTAVLKTHGMTGTKAHKAWCGMRSRCNLNHAKPCKGYALRGITVCDRWRNSFANFYADMGEPPSPHHSLERINNDIGYSPDNCMWATDMEQAKNKRSNRFIEWNGERKHLAEWARIHKMQVPTLKQRLDMGWSVHDAFTRPVMTKKRRSQ